MYIINGIRLYSHRRHTYIGWQPIYVCCLHDIVKTVFRQHENNKFYILKHIHVLNNTTQRQMCTWNQIAMIIVKSEWLNLRLLVTEG